MTQERTKKKDLAKKLLHKYRLVILNEDTFEERLSFKLTRLNVFILVGISSIVLITFTTLLIAFTPLREYIPGYSSTTLKRNANKLLTKTDSLQYALRVNDQYYNNIKKILTGDVSPEKIDIDSLKTSTIDAASLNLTPSKEDSLLRERVDQEDKYNFFNTANSQVDIAFYAPVSGTISQPFDVANKHYAVDIVSTLDTPVKAAASGTVIFAEWTADTGHVVIIEHTDDLTTVYKHNSSLLVGQGELVEAGEIIATVGSTGELTTGPHLHFELWSNGYPVNPINFIDFN